MKTRNSDPSFPIDMVMWVALIVVPLMSMALTWIMFDRGLPWMLAYAGAVLIVMAGAVKMFRAKLPQYRQGRFFTFGPQSLPASSMSLYWGAVKLIAVGVAAALLLLAPRLLF